MYIFIIMTFSNEKTKSVVECLYINQKYGRFVREAEHYVNNFCYAVLELYETDEVWYKHFHIENANLLRVVIFTKTNNYVFDVSFEDIENMNVQDLALKYYNQKKGVTN